MRVHVRLFASLRDRFPGAARGRGDVELASDATLADLIEHLAIPDRLAQMVLVDGQQAPRKGGERVHVILSDGQTVSIFPPVSGG
ncbi:MAG: MoaD/ThiS family protein [Myxococcota bacterium]